MSDSTQPVVFVPDEQSPFRREMYEEYLREGCTFGPEPCYWCKGTKMWHGDPEDIAMELDDGHLRPCDMCCETGLERNLPRE